jgi:hypothetical protein
MKKLVVCILALGSISAFAGEVECNKAIKNLEDKAVNLYVSNALMEREGRSLTHNTYNTVQQRKEEIQAARSNVKAQCDL